MTTEVRARRTNELPMNQHASRSADRTHAGRVVPTASLAAQIAKIADDGNNGVVALKLATGGAALIGIHNGTVTSAHCTGRAGRSALDACLEAGVTDGAWWRGEAVAIERALPGTLAPEDWTRALDAVKAQPEGGAPDAPRRTDAPPIAALDAGTVIGARLSIEREIAPGATCTVAYEASYLPSSEPMLVIEHAPRGLAARGTDRKTIVANDPAGFARAAAAWKAGAQRLSTVRDPALAYPLAIDDANGTTVVVCRRTRESPPTRARNPHEALELAKRLLRALAAVHAQGVVGPDLRECPHAIPATGYVAEALADLSLPPAEPCGIEGMLELGTPSVRADLLALGAALLAAIEGAAALPSAEARCFPRTSPAAHRTLALPHWSPPTLSTLVQWLVHPMPWKRPASAAAALQWIERAGEPVRTEIASPTREPPGLASATAPQHHRQPERPARARNAYESTPSPELVAAAREALAEQLGPLADVEIDAVLERNVTVDAFIEQLSDTLTTYPQAKTRFTDAMLRTVERQEAAIGLGPGLNAMTMSEIADKPPSSNVVAAAREALTEMLGPLAEMEIRERVDRAIPLAQFIDELADTLAEHPQVRTRFIERMRDALAVN